MNLNYIIVIVTIFLAALLVVIGLILMYLMYYIFYVKRNRPFKAQAKAIKKKLMLLPPTSMEYSGSRTACISTSVGGTRPTSIFADIGTGSKCVKTGLQHW